MGTVFFFFFFPARWADVSKDVVLTCFDLFRGRCISVRLNPLPMHFCKRKRGLLSTHPTSPAAATLPLPIFTPLIMHESQIGHIHLRRSFRTGFGFTEGFQTFTAAIILRKVDLGVWCEEWLMQVRWGLFFLAQNHLFFLVFQPQEMLTGVLFWRASPSEATHMQCLVRSENRHWCVISMESPSTPPKSTSQARIAKAFFKQYLSIRSLWTAPSTRYIQWITISSNFQKAAYHSEALIFRV